MFKSLSEIIFHFQVHARSCVIADDNFISSLCLFTSSYHDSLHPSNEKRNFVWNIFSANIFAKKKNLDEEFEFFTKRRWFHALLLIEFLQCKHFETRITFSTSTLNIFLFYLVSKVDRAWRTRRRKIAYENLKSVHGKSSQFWPLALAN